MYVCTHNDQINPVYSDLLVLVEHVNNGSKSMRIVFSYKNKNRLTRQLKN